METWFSFPPFTTPLQEAIRDQGIAIRKQNQEPNDCGCGEWDPTLLLDLESWSSPPPESIVNQEFAFVNAFINANDATIDVDELPIVVDNGIEELGAIDKGLRLIQLLLSCAEAIGCRDTHLASSTLDEIFGLANPSGDSIQRVSFCFAVGLRSRRALLLNVGINGSLTSGPANSLERRPREEKAEAFGLLHRSTPYVAFGFMAANEAMAEAAQGADSIHIIDLGTEHLLQWPSLIRTLASRPEGPPRVRITGIVDQCSNDLLLELVSCARELTKDASSLGMQLEFSTVAEAVSPAVLRAEKLGIKGGERVFVNSITQLHKYVKESRGSLKAILVAIKKLRPAAMTVVEQDANHNGPFFLARFLESLHYYSAVFDSLEAGFSMGGSVERMKIEGWHFGEEIRSIVAYEGGERVERHERADQWRRQLGRAGFQVVGLRSMSQARMLVSGYGCEGYTVAAEKGCLVLGWKGRPIIWASAWQVHPSPSS